MITSFASGSKATAAAPKPMPATQSASANQKAPMRRRNVCGHPRASHSQTRTFPRVARWPWISA